MLEIFSEICLDKNSKAALYVQLSEKLKKLISDGILLKDYKLPSIRQLSKLLEINQITVVSAYRTLESEGFVYSKPGSGSYVSGLVTASHGSITDNGILLDELYLQDDMPLINSSRININEKTINFASATPTPDLFPVDDFKASLNEVLERDKGNAFSYQDSQGFYLLRESISNILQKSSFYCNPKNIQIISGAQQGIDIISKALLKQGDYVITESPTYTGAIAVFKSRGAEIADVELGEDGPNLNLIEYTLKKYKPKLIYTIPSFQNPTGYSYSNARRQAILKLAEKHGAYIIEDDYISDLNFEGRNHTPIKAMDSNDRVIFIKSFSKIFMPGLRLGYMIFPGNLHENIIKAKHTTDISTSGLIQRAFDIYIRRSFWDKHFKFMYEIYKERYFLTVQALDSYLPDGISYYRPGGGLNIWLNLPYGFSTGNLFNICASRDIAFAPGRIFYSSTSPSSLNNVRISFASVHTGQIEAGIKAFCTSIESVLEKHPRHNIPIL